MNLRSRNLTIQLFVIQYNCTRCEHQFFECRPEIEPLTNCSNCQGLARAINVVSLFHTFHFSQVTKLLCDTEQSKFRISVEKTYLRPPNGFRISTNDSPAIQILR